MSKYVITWPHRIGVLYFRRAYYSQVTGHKQDGTVDQLASPKTIERTANLSEAQIYNSFDDANADFSRHIEPDAIAEIVPVTDKDLFRAKLADDPVASRKQNGIST
jgi:hypothetical protein